MKTFRVLFNDDMARAIVSGRKDVTRRPVVWYDSSIHAKYDESNAVRPCTPGDILIGRECWCELRPEHYEDTSKPRGAMLTRYATRVNGVAYRCETDADGDEIRRGYGYKWRPSIHMPDWAARIRRRVVSVTVERLQDTTEEDAVREGIRRWTKDGSVYKFGHVEPGDIGCTPWVDMARTGRDAFARLWDSIYAAKGLGWPANPWVWRIEFERENVQEVSHGR